MRAGDVLSADYGRLRALERRFDAEAVAPDDTRRGELARAIAASGERRRARAASVPPLSVDASLPIARETERIVELIRAHPVIVVAGETGSGKTTQLPKLCLAAGRGAAGMIGCTQPRRIAARSVARRVAQELGTEVGQLVGFQVRFTDQVGPDTLVKFMTDGILLAETQSDAWLSRYDTIIVDEAHERSLNIDFLLGYLQRLVRRRSDLKVIVTSATIDTARFAAHFGGAPVVDVEGRGFPVEVRWRPDAGAETEPQAVRERVPPGAEPVAGIVAAVDAITQEDPRGDILVFLAGEREIRETHLALSRRRYRATDVLPLYARLSSREQDRVFAPGVGRRIVLATNVAETSLTVPGIRYVVDPGVARVNRYSHRHKVQRLQIEPISQASADQRKGRCGRVGPGVCYRLYSEADFLARPRYTQPELLRASLAGVILRLTSLRLGAIEEFPFLDRPNERAIADGYQQLLELGALSADRRALTPVGRALARLPIDVKLGRMLVESVPLQTLREVIVLAAFLSIQDPRERPGDAREAADRAHAGFADSKSDFVGVLKLWEAYRVAHEDLTQSRLREWCGERFLSFLRMREWRELHRQLLLLCTELGWTPAATAAKYEAVHRALLSGFVGQVGRKDAKGLYQGTRGRKFAIFPGSALARHAPKWLMSAIYLDTTRLYGLMNAQVEPRWIEEQALHLLQRRYFDPHWSRESGRVLAFEQVTLFGLTLVERRRVAFGNIDPPQARAVFIRDALVPADIDTRAAFVHENRAVLERALAEEEKRRRRGMLRSDEELYAWLDARLPAGISSSAALDAWWKTLDGDSRRAMAWTLADVFAGDPSGAGDFPQFMVVGGRELPLEYRFDPGHGADGVTLVLPLDLLNAVPEARLGWLVPGLLPERVAELIRSLPKQLRRNFVPAPDFARAFAAAVEPDGRVLTAALAGYLERVTGVAVPPEAWREDEVPPHLRMNLRLLDEAGAPLAESRELATLRADYGARAREEFARTTAVQLAREGMLRFEVAELPAVVATDTGLEAFPAFVDTGDSVAIRVFESRTEADAAHRGGILRLVRFGLADRIRQARKQLPLTPRLALSYSTVDSPDKLRDDVVEAALLELVDEGTTAVRSRVAFEERMHEIGRQLFAAAVPRLELVEEILRAHAALVPTLTPELMGYARANYDDLREQLAGLVYPGFARSLTRARLAQLPRYLKAMALRVERIALDARRDQARMLEVREFVDAHRSLLGRAGSGKGGEGGAPAALLERLRWLIEEYRVQVFAQDLGTKEAVSEKRLRRLLAEIEALL